MVAAVADVAVAALSDVLETNDKQHLSITILLNDNQQLQDKLEATKAELSNVGMEKHTALDACAATELLLAESQASPDTQMILCIYHHWFICGAADSLLAAQEAAKQARIVQSRMLAHADAASQAAAAAEAKLAGQAVTGRGYMERMALLKSQLHDLQKRLESQVILMCNFDNNLTSSQAACLIILGRSALPPTLFLITRNWDVCTACLLNLCLCASCCEEVNQSGTPLHCRVHGLSALIVHCGMLLQGTDVRVMRSQATQTEMSVCQSSAQQEQTLSAVNASMPKEVVAQQLPQQLQAACPDAQDISSQLATSQKAQKRLQAEVLELTQRESDTTAKLASKQAELDAAQAHAIALQDQLASSDQHLSQSKHDLASAQAGFQQALDQQGSQHAINVPALEEQLLAVQQEHAKAAEQLSDITKQHQESKLQGHHIQCLQAAAAETAQVNTAQQQRHHAQLSAMQEERDGLQGQLVQAQARVESTSQHSVQLQHDLQAQLALAAQQAAKADTEHEQVLAGVQVQIATAQAQAAQQADRADKLEASWATTHEQLATTTAQLAEYVTSQNQGQETIDGLLLQVQQLQKESAAAKSKHEQEVAASVQSGKEQADAAAQEQALLGSHNEARLAQHQEELSHVQAESASQLAALQILCDDLEGKLSAKLSDLANLQEEHSQEVLELHQQLSAAEVAIAAAQSQAAASVENLAEQTSKIGLLTEKLTLALAQGTNLQERLGAAAARLTDSTQDSKATEARLQAEITAIKVAVEDREQLVTQLKTEHATVLAQLQAAEAEACVQQETAQQALVDTQAQHADHVEKLESKLQQTQSDRERQHDQLQQSVQDLSKALEQEGLLSHALNAANQRTSTLDETVKQQQQELTEQTVQQQAIAAQLTAALHQGESALHQLASAEGKITAAQAQAKADSEAAAFQLSTVQHQLAAVQAEQATAEDQHQQALSRLATQLDSAAGKSAELSLALAALDNKLTEAKSQAEADSQSAVQKLVSAISGTDAANETVADMLEKLHIVTSEAVHLQKQLKEQLQTSEEANAQLQTKFEATQQAAAHRQAQHDSQLAVLQKASRQLNDQLQSAQQANAAMQSQSAAAQQENLRCQAQLQSELAAAQQAISQAEAEVQASQQSHREVVSQSEAAQQASYHAQDQLQTDLKLSQEAVAQLSAQLQGSQLTVNNLQQQMQELKESPLHAQLAERHFKQQLAALPQPGGQAEGHPGLHHSLSRGPGQDQHFELGTPHIAHVRLCAVQAA